MATSFVESKYLLYGDFDIQVDYSGVSFDTDGQWTGIQLTEDGADFLIISRAYVGTADVYLMEGSSVSDASVVTTDTSGKLRAVRFGNNLEVFYWTTEWVSLGSRSDFGKASVTVKLVLESIGASTTSYFDNYLVNSGTTQESNALVFISSAVTASFTGLFSLVELDSIVPAVTVDFAARLSGARLDASVPSITSKFYTASGFAVETASVECSFSALVDLYASLDVNVPSITSSFTAQTPISTSLDVNVPSVGASLTAISGAVGSLGAFVPSVGVSFTALGTTFVSFDVDVPSVVTAFSAIADPMASMDIQVPLVTAEFSASTPILTTLDINVPAIEVSFNAIPGLSGSMNVYAPAITCEFSETGESEDIEMDINIPAISAAFIVDNPVTHSILRHVRGEVR